MAEGRKNHDFRQSARRSQRTLELEHMRILAGSLARRTEDLTIHCNNLHVHLRRSEELTQVLNNLRLRREERKSAPLQKIVA